MTSRRPLQLIVVSAIVIVATFAVLQLVTNGPGHLSTPVGTLKPIMHWTDDLVLSDSEVPSGWRYGGGSVDGKFGIGTRYYWFEYVPERDKQWLTIAQLFGVYRTEVQATEVYSQWLEAYFPSTTSNQWLFAPDLSFGQYASQSWIACLSLSINFMPMRTCTGIARYENLVVMITGNVFEDRWLTAQGFSKTLMAADRRIAVVMSGNSP